MPLTEQTKHVTRKSCFFVTGKKSCRYD